jgi:flagellar biosynthesis/type III secretory pathway protein FliH
VADDGPGDSLEEELLFSEVERIGQAHGFQRGYNAGTEAALRELGLESPADPEELDAELTEKEAADLARLQQAVSPLEFDDTYSVIYQEAVEEGYDDGYEAGYTAVMSQSQRDAGLSGGDAGPSHGDADLFGPDEEP